MFETPELGLPAYMIYIILAHSLANVANQIFISSTINRILFSIMSCIFLLIIIYSATSVRKILSSSKHI
jgi:hypothetical protein